MGIYEIFDGITESINSMMAPAVPDHEIEGASATVAQEEEAEPKLHNVTEKKQVVQVSTVADSELFDNLKELSAKPYREQVRTGGKHTEILFTYFYIYGDIHKNKVFVGAYIMVYHVV